MKRDFQDCINYIKEKYNIDPTYWTVNKVRDFIDHDPGFSAISPTTEDKMKTYHATFECVCCGHKEKLDFKTKEDYLEIISCPKCNGVFVDIYKKHKYVNHSEKKNNPFPLLRIELDDINSVPKIFYKGEEINGLVKVGIDWSTNTDKGIKPTHIRIEHVEDESNIKVIEHNPEYDLNA
ncbi:hypothetical protein PU629_07195 [Pullulanibacillus sp. KACC 23026]|uniref:hypothetical protein n=1 Tax=Pullulanibacillus sp. KACC 23026 TaxID=3028315 RepID=UPI0023AFCE19|nr:hypothetical protein [Pullulanibacillus sp. KACC 23026]WEG14143.1 hypothetical protein PU629_07195 [Pullulanibacillus sp. KACC 23026]